MSGNLCTPRARCGKPQVDEVADDQVVDTLDVVERDADPATSEIEQAGVETCRGWNATPMVVRDGEISACRRPGSDRGPDGAPGGALLAGDEAAPTGPAVAEDLHGVASGAFQLGDLGVDPVDNHFQAPSFALARRFTRRPHWRRSASDRHLGRPCPFWPCGGGGPAPLGKCRPVR